MVRIILDYYLDALYIVTTMLHTVIKTEAAKRTTEIMVGRKTQFGSLTTR